MSSCCPKLGVPATGFEKPARAVESVYLHCTASSNPNVDAVMVNRWHLDRGWSCIGYHYLIKTDGTVQHGRSLEKTPAAQSGYNTGSIAICLNGLNPGDFNEKQFEALRKLCAQINEAYGGKITFHGHNEVAARACPVFDYRGVLGLNEEGFLTDDGFPEGFPPGLSTIPMVAVTTNLAQLGDGDAHPHVRWVRALLGEATGADMGADEEFSPWLADQVAAFQEREGLVADGIVGVKTWERLLDVGDD